MAANPAPPSANPCCAALQARCSKLEERRNALRQGCKILKDQLSRLEADHGNLKKAYDEEHARADQERSLKEKETAFRISVESKVAELESQLSSMQQAGSSQFQNLDKELIVLQEKLSEREAEIDRLKQLLKEESRRVGIEKKNAEMERHKAVELSEALEAQKNRATETCTCNHADAKTVDASETNNAIVLQFKKLAEENARKFTEEQSYANNLLKQLEEHTLKVERLQKETLELRSFRESAEACFATQLSEKEAELNQLKNLLEVEKSRVDAEQKRAAMQENFALHLSEKDAELNQLKNLLQIEKSRAQVEQKKAAALKENLELEKIKCLESYNLAQAEAKRAKDSIVEIDKLKKEMSKSTLEQSKYEDLTKKFEAEKRNVVRERQCADAEKVKVLELKKLTEENEKKLTEERSNSRCLLHQMEEERKKVSMLQKQVQELLSSGKPTANGHSDSLKLKEAYSKLEAENKMLIKKRKRIEKVKDLELKKLVEENEKKVMKESSRSKQLLRQMKEERQKVETLQKQVQELLLSVKSTVSGHSDSTKLKEVYPKLEAENRMLIRERKCVEAERARADGPTKLSELNEKDYLGKKCSAGRSSQELEMCKQRITELEEQLRRLKLSRKLVGDSTVPDVNMSIILLHEQLKLEKKRLKHAKQVSKLEKARNNILQCELGKLKQDFVQMVQYLDVLEETFCVRTQAVGDSTKSSDLLKLQSLYLKKMLLGANLFEKNGHEFVMPGSSARCAPGSVSPTAVYSQPENNSESPSGIKTKVHPLLEGPLQAISPSSALNSSAASFSDKQLLGPKEQFAGSLATSTIVVDGNPNPQETFSNSSGEVGKRKYQEHLAAVVDNSSRCPLDSASAHGQKRRQLRDEVESLKHMQFETGRSNQESKETLSEMNSKFSMLMGEQSEATRHFLPDKVAAQHGPCKKRKVSQKPKVTLEHSHDLAEQNQRGKTLASAILPAPSGSSKECIDFSDRESLLIFEQQLDGNFMKLLDLDNEVDEEFFRSAMENPLSPTLPEINCENSGLAGSDPSGCVVNEGYRKRLLTSKDIAVEMGSVKSNALVSDLGKYHPGSASTKLGKYDHMESERNGEYGCPASTGSAGIGFEQVHDGTMVSSALVSVGGCAKQTDNSELGMTIKNIPLFCILFSSVEDTSRITRVFFAIRRCIAQCFLHSQADWILMDLLTALTLEQQLTPREKTCVLFSLCMYDFLRVSLAKLEADFDQSSSSSFSLYLCSVLSDVEKKRIFSESCDFSELLCLYEEFVAQRRIFFCRDKGLESNSDFSSKIEILLEGKEVGLYQKTASTREVLAGSVIFSTICLAVGQISILCDVSFNILQMWPAEPRIILYILHCFACLCGGRYFLISNCCMQKEVVKSMVTFLESAYEVQGGTLGQSGCQTGHPYLTCDRCLFLGSLQPLDILSLLIGELQKYAFMPIDCVDSSSRHSTPDYMASKEHRYCYINIMSSVELFSIIMGWSWTTERVLPELQKLLETSTQGTFSTSLVLLLGRIGRLGVKSCGYEDVGVQSVKQCLSSLSSKIPSLESKHVVASALLFALDEISLDNKKDGAKNKLNYPTGLSASSFTSIGKCYSSLSTEQKGLLSTLPLLNKCILSSS